MTDLERSLASLAREIEWPRTPRLALELPERRRSRRRTAVLAGLAIALAAGAVLAIPPARSAILRFFSFGGVAIERVATLPMAQERPLAATLGRPVSAETAARILGVPMRLPPARGRLQLYREGTAVSALFGSPDPVLLSEFRFGAGSGILKKLVSGSTGVRAVQIAKGIEGIWISGTEHLYLSPVAPPRLAGNVLIWQRGEITFRLEAPGLDEQRALRLAREIGG